MSEEDKKRLEEEERKAKYRAELSMFGVRQKPNGEWAPILERVENNPCKKCRGYGTYGNPLCGAVYTCTDCNGTGESSNAEPEPAPTTSALIEVPRKSYFQRFLSLFK